MRKYKKVDGYIRCCEETMILNDFIRLGWRIYFDED